MRKTRILAAIFISTCILTTGCASTPEQENSDTITVNLSKTKTPAKTNTKEETKKQESKKEPEDPPNIKFVKQLQAKLDAGDTKGAIECFDSIPKGLEKDMELKLLLGALYISDSQYDNAITTGNKVLEVEPQNMDALELISMAQRAKGDKKSYKETLDRILTADPFNSSANVQKAEDYALSKKWKLARECYRKALKGDKTNMDARFGYAQMTYYSGDIDDAKDAFQYIIDVNPNDAAAYAYLGKIAAEEENYLKATKYVTKAIELDPKNYDYWVDYGNDLRYQGKYDEAIKAWNKAVELDSSYFLAYSYLAGIYDEQNKYDEALKNYLKVIETNPKYYYAYEEIAILAYHLEKYDDAIKYFNKTYEYSDSFAYKLMIAACYQKKGDNLKAKNTLLPILKTLNKDSTEYLLVRFWCEAYSRNAETSLIAKINKEDNSNKRGKMLFYMGLYYELNGFGEKAAEYYAKVTGMQAPMFFEYRIAEWGLLK